jgi:C4-dicarboxylate-specific signal transduction histidine kinase
MANENKRSKNRDEQIPRESLVAADRVNSMANLARGIAHEINNPLATCVGYLSRAISQAEALDGATALIDTLRRLEHGTHRIRGIVAELQMLSEELIGEHEKLDLAAVLKRVCRLVPPELRAQLDVDVEQVWVWIDRPRLYQIAYNIIMPHLLAARQGSDDEPVVLRCMPTDDGAALVEVIARTAPSPGTRIDLLSALRGEYTPTTLPLRLARRLAIEVGGRWYEGPIDDGHYRTAILLDAV